MRKTIAILSVLLMGALSGCDDPMELDNKKALLMLEECPDEYGLTKVMPIKAKYIDFRMDNMKELQKAYEALESQGLITLTKTGSLYHIDFTEKGKELAIISPKELKKYDRRLASMMMLGSSNRYVITSRREVSEVLEIQEVPQLNMAEAIAKLEITEKTPFHFLEEAVTEHSMRKRFRFRKTTEGWKYCEPE
ncbi:MAG: hypothetical protein AAGH81_08640 [Bacteroidota bacterium]